MSILKTIENTIERKKNQNGGNDNVIFGTWYDDRGNRVKDYTFQGLWNEAGSIAYSLRMEWGVKKGDLVVLCYDFGLHFFAAFLGCLRAGVTAVIVYPPSPPLVKSLTKMQYVIDDCSPVLILTDSNVNMLRNMDMNNPFSKSRHLWPSPSKLKVKVTNNGRISAKNKSFDEPNINPTTDLAFLQYTSGSTGNPKGVMVTHDALSANVQIISDAYYHSIQIVAKNNEVVGFSWLPQYHDLGLIQCIIAPFTCGWRMHMMSPVTFIRNPLLWVELMSRHKVQWSAAPDFAFRLVARKFQKAEQQQQQQQKSKKKNKLGVIVDHPIPDLDLSSIWFLQNAAEPIRKTTREIFGNTFEKYGLPPTWFLSGYGLAEYVVCVSWHWGYSLQTEEEGQQQQQKESYNNLGENDKEPNSQLEFVAVAQKDFFHPTLTLKIVDPESQMEVPDGQSGEIWISGPCKAAGYYGQPELSNETFQARIISTNSNNNNDNNNNNNGDDYVQDEETRPDNNENYNNGPTYLRTGDRGFFKEGRLYICGRYKDLIIMNGVNYYPQDIENVVQDTSPEHIRPGCCAAFSSDDTGHDGELVVIFEIRNTSIDIVESICFQVQAAISKQIGLMALVVAIKERTICKTTSGKIQRRRNRSYLNEHKHQIIYQVDSLTEEDTAMPSTPLLDQSRNDQEQTSGPSSSKGNAITFDVFLQRMFGINDVKDNQTWSDLDVTSMQSVEIANFVQNKEGAHLPPNFMDIYPTIGNVKEFILKMKGKPIDISTPYLNENEAKEISWTGLTILQSIGLLLLLVLITAPIIPAAYFAAHVKWYIVPMMIPIWMIGYTILIIAAKWVVIGTYKEQEIVVPSVEYVKWWFIDRAMYVYDFYVGKHIKGSPIQLLVYTLMGARIHPSANINAPIREFDLVYIGKHVSVDCSIRCSKFANETKFGKSSMNKKLLLRKIHIQSNSTIDGHLSPGVLVGSGSNVESHAMVEEGGQIPKATIVRGNPACNFGSVLRSSSSLGPSNPNRWWQLGMLKILSYPLFVFMSFGCFGSGFYVISTFIVWNWRFAPNFLTFFSILLGFVFQAILNILLKWIFIGKRRPGPCKDDLYTAYADWFVDTHYRIIYPNFFCNSQMWNIFLKLYGMDIDFRSKAMPHNFPPSKVDLISMKRSFTSTCTFSVKKDGMYCRTMLDHSSVGWGAHIKPGLTITNGLIAPRTVVSQNLIRQNVDSRILPLPNLILFLGWIVTDIFYILVWGLVVIATIPVTEIYGAYFYNLSYPNMTIPVFSFIMVLYTITVIICFIPLRLITYRCSNQHNKPWNSIVFRVAVNLFCFPQVYTLLPLTWGAPIFNWVAKFMGAKFVGNGHVLLWGMIHDFPYMIFEENTIVDNAFLSGHHVVFHKMSYGHVNLSGIIHPMTYIMANVTTTDDDETRPWTAPMFCDDNNMLV